MTEIFVTGSAGCAASQPSPVREPRSIFLPYDGSPVARAALLHVCGQIRRRQGARVTLVLPSRPRCVVQRRRGRARLLAGLDGSLPARVLGDDLAASLRRLAADRPASTFVVGLAQQSGSPWYRDVAHLLLTGRYGSCLALHQPPAGATRSAAERGRPCVRGAQDVRQTVR